MELCFTSLLLFLACLTARAQVTSVSRTVVLGGKTSFFVPSSPVSSFAFKQNDVLAEKLLALGKHGAVPLIPFSFITTSSTRFTQADLAKVSATWSTLDDVWTPMFLSGTCYAELSYSLLANHDLQEYTYLSTLPNGPRHRPQA